MRSSKPLELEGKQFGLWTVVGRAPAPEGKEKHGRFWLARCVCGTEQVHSGGKLNANRGAHGCVKCRNAGGAAAAGKMTPEYQSWRGMKERCLSKRHASYAAYGGRGIKVHPSWLQSFKTFLEDMGPRPRGHSLDRIDVNGDYEPSNCRWATQKTQNLNTREARLGDSQVAAILNLLASGARQIDIADAVGFARSHIANIATGHSRNAG